MENRYYYLKLFFQIIIYLNVFFIVACGSTGQKQKALDDQDFMKRAVPVKQAELLPAEIIRDIEKITDDGRLVYIEDSSGADPLGDLTKATSSFSENSNDKPADESQKSMDNKTLIIPDEKDLNQNASVENESFVNESDLVIQDEQGPLAKSMSEKNLGPLSFKADSINSGLKPLEGGKTVSYIVKLGDTLMEIAFEKYGNYLRWKDVFRINKHKMKSPKRMQVGTELTIKNVKYVYIKRDGKPYLIKKMDTLKSISQKLYGTPNRWQEIWKNNPQLIQNPKRIYAGFTLYYPSDVKTQDHLEKRNPASNRK